jgi:hypothetical protein
MQWLSLASDIIGVLGGIFAFFAWVQTLRLRKDQLKERERMNGKIRVILSYNESSYELPFHLRRSELTRAELLGRVGMIPVKDTKARFGISHFNSKEFFVRLNEIVLGEGNDILMIPCRQEEFEQFTV